jgi:hypothetical protein
MTFNVGDRVQVKPSAAISFIQPWRGRFEKGRIGTVISGPKANIRGYLVQWDCARCIRPRDWQMDHRPEDLTPAP